jgi:hypothetical protein
MNEHHTLVKIIHHFQNLHQIITFCLSGRSKGQYTVSTWVPFITQTQVIEVPHHSLEFSFNLKKRAIILSTTLR